VRWPAQWRPAPVQELFVEMGNREDAEHVDPSGYDHDVRPLQDTGVVFVGFQKRE
jgi:hypothetical protein